MQSSKSLSIVILRWVVGVVVLVQSLHFTLARSAAQHASFFGLAEWHRYALGGSEIIGALLFLIPAGTLVGGTLLLVIFAIAALIHFHHGQFDVQILIVYAAAVFACLANRNK